MMAYLPLFTVCAISTPESSMRICTNVQYTVLYCKKLINSIYHLGKVR